MRSSINIHVKRDEDVQAEVTVKRWNAGKSGEYVSISIDIGGADSCWFLSPAQYAAVKVALRTGLRVGNEGRPG